MFKKISKTGIIGESALREAFDGDLRQLGDLLQGAIKKALELTGDDDWWPYMRGLFPGFVVVEAKDGKLLRYGYSVDGTDVILQTPQEVVQEFVAVASEAGAKPFMEADASMPGVFLLRVIKAGLSGNRNYYSNAVLREATPLFDGVRVLVKSDEEHLAGKGKDVRNLIGRLSDPAFIEGIGVDQGEIRATLTMIEPEGDMTVKLREACSRGLTDLFGFSIDASGKATRGRVGGQTARIAQSLSTIKSVDLIVEPGAGGGIIDLVEAQGDDNMLREQLIKLIEAKRPDLLTNVDLETVSDDRLEDIFSEAIQEPEQEAEPEQEPAAEPQADFSEALQTVEAKFYLREALGNSRLPEAAKKKIKSDFGQRTSFTEAQVDDAIKAETEYLAQFTSSGTVQGLGGGSMVEMIESQGEKYEKMLDAFFDPADSSVRSFKECYVAMTGDKLVTGRIDKCHEATMREALGSSSFTAVLGDGMNRKMVREYNDQSQYDVWRKIAEVGKVDDFRTQERTRFGGYGDLPTVAESGAYTALTSPTDEKAEYAVTKRGGTEKITLEMIKNDDVGSIRRIPSKMARAAKRTLSKFALDFMRTNPVIYDGVNLFHATHGNLGSAALASASLAAARLAMLKQPEKDSDEPMSIGPQTLWVAADLEEDAVDMFRRNTENDKTFQQSLSLEVVPVWYWTDVNDWVVSANLADIPMIEIGFLDGNEEPEMFIQDNPLVGSMFTNDEVTYKIRHIYGGNVMDYRGLYKSVVA
jgi:hypothetical protein